MRRPNSRAIATGKSARPHVSLSCSVVAVLCFDAFVLSILALNYIVGFPVVFNIPDSGVYKAETKAAKISPAEFMRGNTRMTAHIQRSLEKEAEGEDTDERAEQRAQCWKKTKERSPAVWCQFHA